MPILVCGIILSILGCILSYFAYQKIKNQIIADDITLNNNKLLNEENLKLVTHKNLLLESIQELENKKEQLVASTIENINTQQQTILNSLERYCDTLEDAYLAEETSFDLKIEKLANTFKQKEKSLQEGYENDKKIAYDAFQNYLTILLNEYKKAEDEFDTNLSKINQVIADKKEELDLIAATWRATREAQIREEEIRLKSDFYRLHISEIDANTIKLLDELKPRLPDPRVLCKLIWSTYFQKQATALCNNVLGINSVCGIYKITNIKSGLCYIGQATNIADRWKTHIKCGLGIDTPAQNKLYKAMQTDGITNFTFELLEQCDHQLLNEKERFYIDLYQSYDFGYNSTKGNK